jgi:hypothetical protein
MAKIKFENGGFMELPDGDSPDAGRGLRPFEFLGEMDDNGIISGIDYGIPGGDKTVEFLPKKISHSDFPISGRQFSKAFEEFSSHLIENGKHFSMKGKLKNGRIFIEEENVEDTDAKDDEYVLFDSKNFK